MNRQLLSLPSILRSRSVLRLIYCKKDTSSVLSAKIQQNVNFHSKSNEFSLKNTLKTESQFVVNFSTSTTLKNKMGSEVGTQLQNVEYEGLLEAQKNNSVLIIDVREQKEIDETGKLPGSIHIPMGNVKNVLETVSSNEFKDKYGKSKPEKDTKIILSCRAGGRSKMVQDELQKMGYSNAWNYIGGWLEWENKHKS